jgi:Glycosyltransferase 61
VPALLQPDVSVVIKSPPRMERYQSVTATPFRQGGPITAGTRFPYTVSGALYSKDGALIGLSRRVSGVTGDHVVLADPDRIEDSATVVRVPGRGCYLGHLFEHYGHFITESLSALWPIMAGERFEYFVAHPFGAVHGLNEKAAWAFGRFGIKPLELYVINRQTWFEELTVPERTWQANESVHAAYWEIVTAVSRPFWRAKRPRKIYLSRSKVANRCIENGGEIEEEFARRGFDIVHPQTMSLEEQLRQFGTCDILAGVSGSALHNIVFCPPGTAVVSVGDRRTRDTLLPNQRLCNAISSSQMALIPFAEGERGFDLSMLRAELSAAEKLITSSRRIDAQR